MKAKIMAIIALIGCAFISFLAIAPLDRPLSASGSAWMKEVSGGVLLNQISIPGSHDSGATHSIGDLSGKCQTLSVKDQLSVGVRFFDVRLKLNGSRLDVVHSFVDQKLTFAKLLDDATDFIKQNPSEFLILSIKEDHSPANPQTTFDKAVKQALEEHNDVISLSQKLPTTLEIARGKIYIMSRYNTDIGIPMYAGWKDDASFELGAFYVQDNYSIDDINDKKSDIASTFEISAKRKHNLVLNFTSCYLNNAFPPTYAGTAALDVNLWLSETIDRTAGCLGVVISDFVTQELAQKIYGRNFV